MTWFLPIMSVSISLVAPLGLALYWLVNNILIIIERSRSHRTPEVDEYINEVLRPAHPDLVIDSQGSSLKFARLVEGTADVYVCFSKTKEWDTAAADAILTAAGGKVLRISDGMPLEYDKEDYPNPPFVAWAPGRI